MGTHSIAEASEQLAELIGRARGGEPIVITEAGKPVAEITPVSHSSTLLPVGASRSEWLDWLQQNRVGTKTPSLDAGTLVSRMRDEGEH